MYSSYYCLALNFFGKNIFLGIWEEKFWAFPGTWSFEMFSGNMMWRGGRASVVRSGIKITIMRA